jgi:polyhydroxyalkanoate synthesis regulator phasin
MRLVPADVTLVDHLVATTGLTAAEAARVVEDVLAFHDEPVEDYVRRRHAELKTRGTRNPEIFADLAEELTQRFVAAPALSERQLRRIVYG